MTPRTLLISDLHLDESRPDISAALLGFLHSNKGRCEALYVLGDLFEAWIGDDESTDLSQRVAGAFKSFSESSQLYFMHGNRDFLLGPHYAELCGASLIPDPYILDIDAFSIVLAHGDSLCTDDNDYIEFRNMVRQHPWQKDFLSQTLQQRREFARRARQQSQTATANKASSIMDVNQQEVETLLSRKGKTILIHGHTHRPASHNFELQTDGEPIQASRVVLGDWDKSLWYAEISAGCIDLKQAPLSS
jgi:UDP-2,3-diacylglucosamine hydrolase